MCFGWVPPGFQNTCFCLLLRHLTDFQSVASNSVCTNRGILKNYIAIFRIWVYRSTDLACLLQWTYPNTRLIFSSQIIVILNWIFLINSRILDADSESTFYSFLAVTLTLALSSILDDLMYLPVVLFTTFRELHWPTSSTFHTFLPTWWIYRQRFSPIFINLINLPTVLFACVWKFDRASDSTFQPFLQAW